MEAIQNRLMEQDSDNSKGLRAKYATTLAKRYQNKDAEKFASIWRS